MNYRMLFLISVGMFLCLSIASIVVYSTGRIQTGTPVCTIFNDNSGTRCATIQCNGTAPSGSTCYDDQNNVTTLFDESEQICQLPGTACTLVEQLECDTGNRSASFARECNGQSQTISSTQISCPISCTCPQPIGEKPCIRATWNTDTCSWNDQVCFYVAGGCNGDADYTLYPSTGCASGFVNVEGVCTRSNTFQSRCADPTGYEPETCSCPDGINTSPIIIDVDSSGFSLTDAANGVDFDIAVVGFAQRIAWTSQNSTNAFLVLDRNANGMIDNGAELFGNFTPQPESSNPNGFIALTEYDKTIYGGNGDGKISSSDLIFTDLRLWQDANHNGISEPAELHPLLSLNVAAIELDYKESKKTDEFGNEFRYRSKVKSLQGTNVNRWAWDVFLVSQ